MKKLRAINIAQTVSAVMLLLALADQEYGYYTLLRIVITAVSIWTSVCIGILEMPA